MRWSSQNPLERESSSARVFPNLRVKDHVVADPFWPWPLYHFPDTSSSRFRLRTTTGDDLSWFCMSISWKIADLLPSWTLPFINQVPRPPTTTISHEKWSASALFQCLLYQEERIVLGPKSLRLRLFGCLFRLVDHHKSWLLPSSPATWADMTRYRVLTKHTKLKIKHA